MVFKEDLTNDYMIAAADSVLILTCRKSIKSVVVH